MTSNRRERNDVRCAIPVLGEYAYSVKPHYRHTTCKRCGSQGLVWRSTPTGYRLTTHDSGEFHACVGAPIPTQSAPFTIPAPQQAAQAPQQAPTTQAPEIDIDYIAALVQSRITIPEPHIDYDAITTRVASLVNAQSPRAITIEPYNAPSVTIEHPHPALERVLRYVSRRRNVWLYGPAGTGKTTAASDIARALGLKYYAMSCGPMTQEYGILGYRSADGTFIPGAIYEAYVNGGLFLFDEIDAASPDCLVAVNALLANHETMFGGQMLRKHPDFVVIAAANTVGNGASREYVGRSQIDAATLDRFVMVGWDYDSHLERRIAQSYDHPDALRWHDYVLRIRRVVDSFEGGIRLIVSTRAIVNGCEALCAGIAWDDIVQDVIFARTDEDTAMRVKESLR